MRLSSILALLSLTLTSLPAQSAGSVLIVEDPTITPGAFSDIASAAAAAQPGDTLLVRSGQYDGAVIDKPLSIVGDGVRPLLETPLVVRDIAAGQSILVSNLELHIGSFLAALNGLPFLEVSNCSGTVTFQDCNTVCPRRGAISGWEEGRFTITNCRAVVFTGSQVVGCDWATQSGHGVEVENSSIYAFNSSFSGSQSFDQGLAFVVAGAGLHLENSFAYLQNTRVNGGAVQQQFNGRGSSCSPVSGNGIELSQSSRVVAVATTFAAGALDPRSCFSSTAGSATVIDATSTIETRSRATLDLSATILARVGQPVDYTINGMPGDTVALAFSLQTDALWFPLIDAPLIVGTNFNGIPIGALSTSGSRVVNTVVPMFATTADLERFTVQALAIRNSASEPQLIGGTPQVLTLLDSRF